MVNVDNLDALLDSVVPTAQAREQVWSRFGFLRNPYPSRSHPIWDVFHNQEEVRRRFYEDLVEFMRESTTVTLFFTGGNRVGKTHFMEYHKRELTAKLPDRGVVIPIAVVSAQSCDFRNFYRDVVDQIDESLRLQTGSRLFEDETYEDFRSALEALPAGDFRRAVEAASTAPSSNREEIRLLLRRWLCGDRIRAPQRAKLGVTGLIDSQSQMLSALESLVKLLPILDQLTPHNHTKSPRCLGALIFLDEFELVWRTRRDRRDQFLQALRALIDSCPSGLFLVVAMSTGLDIGMEEVEASYPALFARLKGVRDIPALVQIGYVTEAIGYARAFERQAREEFEKLKGRIETWSEFFSNQEIESFFRELAGRSGSVSQGDFFDQLHTEAERRAGGYEAFEA